MTGHHKRSLLAAGVALSTLISTAAHAQDATPKAAPTDATSQDAQQPNDQIQEIIVTATRHEQSLQKVAAAVQVFDGAAIKDQALSSVGQIFANTPSIQATAQPGGFSVDVRGLGGDLPAGSTQGSSAVVFDGVYNINSQGTTVGFFDVNRVEVAPGPQSTRFGPNADGGIVNIYTSDPKIGQFAGSGALTLANYNLARGEAMINVPLGKDFALRIAGAVLSRSSYFTPSEGSQRAQSIRAKLLYDPGNNLSLKFTYQWDHIGGAGQGSNLFPAFTNKVAPYPNGSINDFENPWAAPGYIPHDPQNINTADITQQTFMGNASYEFSKAIALDVQGTYVKIRGGENSTLYFNPWNVTTQPSNIPGATGAPFYIANAQSNDFAPFNQFTGEVRLHNGVGSKVLWDLGYYHWNYLSGISLQNAMFLNFTRTDTSTQQNALYGEVTYPVTDKFRVTGGLRQSWDHRTFQFDNNGTPISDSNGKAIDYPINFSHFDYRAGVEYDLAPQSMFYASISTGYRPGGLAGFNTATNAPTPFKSEVNTAEEIGLKNRFLNNRLQINFDFFHYRIANYQNLDKYSGFTPTDGRNQPCNTGDSRVACQTPTFGVQASTFGFETQIRALVTPNDVLRFDGTYLHAKFDKKQGSCAVVGLTPAAMAMACPDGYTDEITNTLQFYDIAGAVQPHSPTFSMTAGYDHTFQFGSSRLVAGGSAFYTTGFWVNPVEDANRIGYQPSYWLEEVHAKLSLANDRFSIAAFLRNIGNYAVKQSVLPAVTIGEPRTYGATLGVKF